MVNLLSLKAFMDKYRNQSVAVSWGWKGECVSLVQRYLVECFGYKEIARGNAVDWKDSLIREGIATKVTSPRKGDIVVWGKEYAGGLGHVAIYLDGNTIFDQNRGGQRYALERKPLANPVIYLRLKKELVNDAPTETENEKIARLVKETLRGDHGNGEARKAKLGKYWQPVMDIINGNPSKPSPSKPSTVEFKKGDKVKVVKAVQYNGKPFTTYHSVYSVMEKPVGDRVVIGIGSTVTAAINKANIKKA